MTKKGIVPGPASTEYLAGSVEDPRVLEGKKGHELNSVTEIADSPAVHDRQSSAPECGIKRIKSSAHAHSGDHEVVRGKPYQYQEVKDAEAAPVSRDVVNTQLGSSRRLGN